MTETEDCSIKRHPNSEQRAGHHYSPVQAPSSGRPRRERAASGEGLNGLLPSVHELLNVQLDCVNLGLEFSGLIRRHARSNDGAGDTASTAECSFGWNEDIWDILVLAQQRQVQQNLQRFRVCREDDELRNAAIQRLRGLIRTLFELFVVRSLLDEVKDLVGEPRVCEWPCLSVLFFGHSFL